MWLHVPWWSEFVLGQVHIDKIPWVELTEQRATSLKVSAEGMGGIRGGSIVIVVVNGLGTSNVRPRV